MTTRKLNSPSKVRRPGRLPVLLGTALFGGLLWNGCTSTSPEADEAGRFGAPYEVLLSETPALPDKPPALVGDTLMALLGYSGGCADHAFRLGYRVRRDTAQLWIHHDNHNDSCEAYLQDRVHLPVPDAARAAGTVVLLNPQGGAPFMLQWGP